MEYLLATAYLNANPPDLVQAADLSIKSLHEHLNHKSSVPSWKPTQSLGHSFRKLFVIMVSSLSLYNFPKNMTKKRTLPVTPVLPVLPQPLFRPAVLFTNSTVQMHKYESGKLTCWIDNALCLSSAIWKPAQDFFYPISSVSNQFSISMPHLPLKEFQAQWHTGEGGNASVVGIQTLPRSLTWGSGRLSMVQLCLHLQPQLSLYLFPLCFLYTGDVVLVGLCSGVPTSETIFLLLFTRYSTPSDFSSKDMLLGNFPKFFN